MVFYPPVKLLEVEAEVGGHVEASDQLFEVVEDCEDEEQLEVVVEQVEEEEEWEQQMLAAKCLIVDPA